MGEDTKDEISTTEDSVVVEPQTAESSTASVEEKIEVKVVPSQDDSSVTDTSAVDGSQADDTESVPIKTEETVATTDAQSVAEQEAVPTAEEQAEVQKQIDAMLPPPEPSANPDNTPDTPPTEETPDSQVHTPPNSQPVPVLAPEAAKEPEGVKPEQSALAQPPEIDTVAGVGASVAAAGIVAASTEVTPDGTSTDSQNDAKQSMPNKTATPHTHRNNKKMAVIVTLLITTILAAVAVFVYLSAQENTQESGTSTVDQSTPAADPVADEIDTTQQEVDSALNALDDSADLGEDTLSDEALGL